MKKIIEKIEFLIQTSNIYTVIIVASLIGIVFGRIIGAIVNMLF